MSERSRIILQHLKAGGRIYISEYSLFGYSNKDGLRAYLEGLDKSIVHKQVEVRDYTLYTVYEYFYAKPNTGNRVSNRDTWQDIIIRPKNPELQVFDNRKIVQKIKLLDATRDNRRHSRK